MATQSKPVVVITGVGPGLGAALAHRFAATYAVQDRTKANARMLMAVQVNGTCLLDSRFAGCAGTRAG